MKYRIVELVFEDRSIFSVEEEVVSPICTKVFVQAMDKTGRYDEPARYKTVEEAESFIRKNRIIEHKVIKEY